MFSLDITGEVLSKHVCSNYVGIYLLCTYYVVIDIIYLYIVPIEQCLNSFDWIGINQLLIIGNYF